MDDLTSQFMSGNETALRLGVALLLGALIGLERGWTARAQKAGERIAGIRTYALVGLLGGVAAVLAEAITAWVFPVMLLGVAGMSLVAYRARTSRIEDYSITGLVGLLLTFCFGAVAVAIDVVVATAAAVITALILDNKSEIHGLVNRLQAHELDAGLKLLLISAVMLPLLPNEDLGPGNALNPYQIWWMVVLIATVSFVGYFAVRIGGTEKGILFTSLFAGLSSSTAITLYFARLGRGTSELSPLLAAGILIACGTMFPRVLLYCALIAPALLPHLVIPIALMMLMLYAPALLIWRRNRPQPSIEPPELTRNPLDLKSALLFGAILTVVMLLADWLQRWLGDAGIYMLSAASGIADVDAITLSLTRMSNTSIALSTAVDGIVIAVAVNSLFKAGLAAILGSRTLALHVGTPMLLSVLAGLLTAWWL